MLTFDGGAYDDTLEDRVWLLRAVQVEGRPEELVARALVNGFCWARARRAYRGSLMSWVRSYAQPVNPRWFVGGDLHAKACAQLPHEQAQQERARAHLRETRHARCRDFDPRVEVAVAMALSTPFRSDITDYAAHHIDARSKGYVPRSAPEPGKNRLWTRDVTWRGYDAEDTRRIA